MSIQRLAPNVPMQGFYPRNAAFMTRSDLETTRLLVFTPLNLDSITNIFLGLMNDVATVRHRAGVTDDILTLFERAGLPIEEEMHVYENGEDAEAAGDALIAQGRKLFFVYPPPRGRYADGDFLVAPSLWHRLNSKAHLDELAPPQHLAPRHIGRFADLGAFERPVYLKEASLAANGGGCTIRACLTPESWAKAIEDFRAMGVETVVTEDALTVERCWCVCLVIDEAKTVYAGAAEQVFEAPGVQSSSIIDPEHLLPDEGVRLAIEAGERARQQGYVGIAGMDIGRTSDGRFILFDPNFRINSSSSQTLLHASASQRAGLPVSYATFSLSALPFAEIKRRLLGPIDDGWFLPARLLDAAHHPDAQRTACGGIVLGANRKEAVAAAAKIDAMLAG